MYEIVGIYKWNVQENILSIENIDIEVIDQSENLKEANYLLNQYKLAYGSDWYIYLRTVNQ
jgi:hypothetical protein